MVHANWGFRTLFELGLIGRCQGQAIVNVHHFEATSVLEATLLNDGLRQTAAQILVDDWQVNLLASYRGAHTNDWFLDKRVVQVLQTPNTFEHKLVPIEDTDGLPLAGTIAAAADDLATSAVVRWRSLVAGRRNRGRTYLGPLHDAAVAGGALDAGGQANFTAYSNAMITRYTGAGAGVQAGFSLTIYSRPYNMGQYQYTKRVGGVLTVITPPDYAGNSANVVSTSLDVSARTQRRRQLGVGS